MQRRTLLKSAAGIGVGYLAGARAAQVSPAAQRSGRLKQSVCRGNFSKEMSFEDTCREAARIGFKGYDFAEPKDWPILKKYGLVPSLYPQGPVGDGMKGIGLNQRELHDTLEKSTREALKYAAANGCPTLWANAGRGKVGDEEAADSCVAFFNRVKAQAEDLGVNITLEHLSHPGHVFMHMPWGVEVMKRVNSPRIGILYDFYHVQIMDGNVVQIMRDDIKWINHIHTAGNPGRHQLDDNQELNYRFIARATAELNYGGYVAHEYSPLKGSDPIACLKQAFEIFDV